MAVPPAIENSTREERQTLLGMEKRPEWSFRREGRSSRFLSRKLERSEGSIGRTLRMLHGQNAEDAYAEYITGKRSYMVSYILND